MSADSQHVLSSALYTFRFYKNVGDGALAQVPEDALGRAPAPGMNSIAVLVKHLHGNMLSRWTDLLTTDGEKPWRDRDGEFLAPADASRGAVLARWEEGWACLFGALESLGPGDLMRTTTIRGKPHTVVEAMHRQLAHYGYHVGQIVLLARLFRDGEWTWLSIAPGKSGEYRPEGKY